MVSRKELLERIRDDCAASCRLTAKWLNFNGTDQQVSLFDAVDSGAQYIAAKSGKGIGKTSATGVVATHWTIRGGMGKGVYTLPLIAPKIEQGRDIWLREYRTQTLQNAHPILRRLINVTRSKAIFSGQPDWCIQPKTAADPMRAQGIHDPNLRIIFEEASGIERPMMEAYWSTLTNEGGGGLWIGNPNLRESFFFDCFHGPLAPRFTKLTFNAEESPLVSKAKIQEALELYGRDHDYFRVNISGEFPKQSARAIMSLEDCMACSELDLHTLARRREPDGRLVRAFGIDFARFGDCENAIAQRLGSAIIDIETFAHTDPNDVAERSFAVQIERGWQTPDVMYVADAGGMGQGVMRRFYDAGKRLYEFQFGRKIDHPDYADEQTEAWFGLAKRVKQVAVRLPKDQRLLQQLSTRNYKMTKDGRIQVESKEDYEKRGYESPDRADAVVMAMFDRAHDRVSLSPEQRGGDFFKPKR